MKQKNLQAIYSAAEFQPVFPIEFDYEILPVNKYFSAFKVNVSPGKTGTIDLSVTVPEELKKINVLLLIDDKKYDLYFHVSAGIYTFRGIRLSRIKDKLSLIYFNRVVKSQEQIIGREEYEVT